MTTMTDEWNAYKEAVYGGELHPQQDKECHQAFFAGMLVMEVKMHVLSSLPEVEAVKEMAKLHNEIQSVCGARAMNLGAQN